MKSRGTKRAVSCVCLTLVLGALLTVCAISGCKNTPENHKVLSFFFDGVPDPNEGGKAEGGEGATEDGGPSGPEPSIHEPTRKELDLCGECHGASLSGFRGRGFSGIDIGSIKMAWERCGSCHSDPEKVAEKSVIVRSNRWLHGPVAAGRCQDCHRGHRSELPHLLRAESLETICRSCHEQLPERDGPMAKMECVECHDPHSAPSASDLLLRNGRSGSCAACHPLDLRTRPWLHGPVAKGVCRACHSGHGGAGYENHVLKPVRDACLHCHEPTQICAPGRTPDGVSDCTGCHDPHSATSAADQFVRERIESSGGGGSAFIVEEPAPESELESGA